MVSAILQYHPTVIETFHFRFICLIITSLIWRCISLFNNFHENCQLNLSKSQSSWPLHATMYMIAIAFSLSNGYFYLPKTENLQM